MKKIALLQPPYMPWIGALNQIALVDEFYLGDDFQYSKGSWVNRNRIKNMSTEKPLWLTVPVLQKSLSQTLIRDVKIDNTQKWQDKQLKLIKVNYHKTKFFPIFFPEIKKIITGNYKNLINLNIRLLKYFLEIFQIKTKIKFRSKMHLSGQKNDPILQLCKKTKANYYFTGASAKDYVDAKLFKNAGIKLEFQNYQHPDYQQQGTKFISHLSVVDCLFNNGIADTKKYIFQKNIDGPT